MKYIISIFKGCLNLLYTIFKIKKQRNNKVVFCSRQSDELTVDFEEIQKSLREKNEDLEFVTICSRWQNRQSGIMKLVKATLRSMYHMADAKVCVLDGYWPAACMLKHKKDFSIVQIWHSVGKFKMSGYQSLGNEYGRSKQIAEWCDMHRQYKYVISGGKAWNPFYCASFDVEEDVLRNYGLPRLAKLIDEASSYKEKVLQKYPEFREKKVVLYAPTFRKNDEIIWADLGERFASKDEYCFLCKMHPNQKDETDVPGVYLCPEFSTLELLPIADYVITDYSSLALEAAALDRKVYFYVYDYDEYMKKNGLNFKIKEQLPELAYTDANKLFEDIDNNCYYEEVFKQFKKDYLPDEPSLAADKIANLIVGEL